MLFRFTPLIVAWLIAVGACLCWMNRYNSTPGAAAAVVPSQWPQIADAQLELGQGEHAIVAMFVHPKCPCTRASIAELARLATTCQESLDVLVLLVKPPGADENWERTDLREKALLIPGARVLPDTDGRIAKQFNAVTSGETYFYDRFGQLRFHGGITISRGHHGQNPGRSFIAEYLSKDSQAAILDEVVPADLNNKKCNKKSSASDVFETPVYGCALFDLPIPANQGN